MTQTKISIGIDIGGTNTTWGFVDKSGNILTGGGFATYADEPPEKLVERLAGAIKADFISIDSDTVHLAGIGIGAPNANYHKGTIEHPPNFDWKVVNFIQLMKEHFDLPMVITNDANAAAVGEMTFGSAKGMSDFMVITLGTGLGSGIVTGGRLLLGHDGFAGEMGHILAVQKSSRLCGCGKYGCLETYASATGIVTTATELLKTRTDDSSLRLIKPDELSAKDIGIAAQKNDPVALLAFETTAEILGTQIANAASLLSPQAIFLFGGLANAGDLILRPTQKYMEENLFGVFKNKINIAISGLQHRNAAILGSAALIAADNNKPK